MKGQEKVIINALMNMKSDNDKIDNIYDILDKISINKKKKKKKFLQTFQIKFIYQKIK